MITFNEQERVFRLDTNESTYLFMIDEQGHLEHLYYGPTISDVINSESIRYKYDFELGSSTSYSKDTKSVMLNVKLLEVSTYGKGDYREPTIHLEMNDGNRTTDFTYKTHTIVDNHVIQGMPHVRKDQTLIVTLEDKQNDIDLQLYYSPIEAQNAIVRSITVTNNRKTDIILDKVLSMSLDMVGDGLHLKKLDGAWIRERHISDVPLTCGTIRFDSKKGVSSSDHNPFFIIHKEHTTEHNGLSIGCALVYSGNFEANIETSPHRLLRINMGINSFDFRYVLSAHESFHTPEVILSTSQSGFNGLSNQFHELINTRIISKNHQKPRPILINNWEATYFDFNEKKLLAIAKKAQKLGIECFCLDDGWFGKRNDDFSSLGDWHHNPKKLKHGIIHLARKIRKLGLQFGLWVEPEMVNEDSDLYRNHPDWVVHVPHMKPSLGRNQLILDLSNQDVIIYLKNTLTDLFKNAPISYVKWDMNRNISDVYSPHLPPREQGGFHHKYVMGLYEIYEHLVHTFPDILFEGCSSGGNRFDLGILYYMPQIWTSDNTDSFERLLIQEGTSLLYPLSTISNHVSGDRSHQVMRHTPLETRFNVASFGVLGYELDVTEITPFETTTIKQQIAFYKQHRPLFQYGTFTRLQTVRTSNYTIWMVRNQEKTEAIVGYFQDKALPNPSYHKIHIPGMKEGVYEITNRPQYINIRTFGSLVNEALPIKLKVNHFLHNVIANRYLYTSEKMRTQLTHNQLEHVGLILPHRFTGTGHGEHDMILEDYGSRLYHIKQVK
jgi:alpha-galactosidase